MSEQQDMELCREISTLCAKAGAEGSEVQISRGESRTATWQTDAVTGAVVLGPRASNSVRVRVFCEGGRSGMAEKKSSGKVDHGALVTAAIATAQDAEPNPHAGVAPRLDVASLGLGIFDRRNAMLEDADRQNVVESNLRDCRGVADVRPRLFRYVETTSRRAFRSSRGVELSEAATLYSLKAEMELEADDAVRVEGEVSSRHFADVASIPLGVDLARKVARYQNPIPAPDADLPIVLEPSLVAQMMRAVAPAFDRQLIDSNKSFLKGEIDQTLGSSLLHMIDDAARPGGLATRAFDARGVPPVSIPLIREGAAGAFYSGVAQSEAKGLRPSGHEQADGSAWSGNLLLRSGTRSRNMMFPELGEFLLLDGVVNNGVRCDLAKGTLRLKAHTFLSDGGQVKGYLGVQTFKTTWVDLWSGIREIGSDQQRFGTVDASTWVVDGMARSR